MKHFKIAFAAAIVAISSFGPVFAGAGDREVSKSIYVCTVDEGYGRSRYCDAP